jgi:hypothetical protein
MTRRFNLVYKWQLKMTEATADGDRGRQQKQEPDDSPIYISKHNPRNQKEQQPFWREGEMQDTQAKRYLKECGGRWYAKPEQ